MNIDWTLLREQKTALLYMSQDADLITSERLDGVISLLDAIQDEAVASGVSETEVFGEIK